MQSSNTEHNKFKVEMLQNENMDEFMSNAPIVFVDNTVNELKFSRDGLQEIIDSFHAYKECNSGNIVPEMEEDHNLENYEAVEYQIIPEPMFESLQEKSNESVNSKTNKTKKTLNSKISRYKSKIHKSIEMENLSKQKSLAISLAAYLDCCVSNGMLNRGYLTLLNYRYKYKRFSATMPKVDDKNLFNIVLHGFAEKMNFLKVRELINIMKEDGVELNGQSFAAVFECFGRILKNPETFSKNQFSSEKDVIHSLNSFYNDALERNISLNDILDTSVFIKNQREIVLKVAQIIDPQFEPVYTPPEITYNNELLDDLNRNVQPSNFDVTQCNTKLKGSEIMNCKEGFTRDQYFEFGKEQLQNELNGYVTVKSIENFPEPTPIVLHYRKVVSDLQNDWKSTIISSFNRDMSTVRSSTNTKSQRSINLLPYLRALDVEEYAEILLREIRMLAEGSETYSPTVGQLYRALGNKVQVRYHMQQKRKNGVLQKSGEIYGLYCDVLSKCFASDSPRQCWQRLIHLTRNQGPSMNFSETSWPMAAKMGVGKFLYNILMRDLKIDVNKIRHTTKNSKVEHLLPAFYTLFRNQGRIVKEEVKPHPVLSKLFRGSRQETLTFEANAIPLFCPPQPWSEYDIIIFLLNII